MWRQLGHGMLVLVLVFVLGACWSRHEIDHLALVMTMGLDEAPEGVLVTIQFPMPAGQQGGGSDSFVTAAATGRNLDEAGHRLLQRVGRFVTWTHLQTVVVSADYARNGVRDALDFLMRLPQVRETARVLVSDGPAADLIAIGVEGEIQPGTGLRQIMTSALREGFAPWTEIVDFAGILAEPGLDPVTPVVRPGARTVTVGGAAVFRDDRLVGLLDEAETRGLMAVIGKGRHLEVPLDCPGTGEPALLRADGRESRTEPLFQAGRLAAYRVTLGLTAHPSVLPCRGELKAEGGVTEVEQAAARAVHRSVDQALKRARELQADIFGLGVAALRRGAGPAAEHAWGEVPVQVSVRLTLSMEGTQVESPTGGRAP